MLDWAVLWHEPWRFAQAEWLEECEWSAKLKIDTPASNRLMYKKWCGHLALPRAWSSSRAVKEWSAQIPVLQIEYERFQVLEFMGAAIWISAPNFPQRWLSLPADTVQQMGVSIWRAAMRCVQQFPLAVQTTVPASPTRTALINLGLAWVIATLSVCAAELWTRLRLLFPPDLVTLAEFDAEVIKLEPSDVTAVLNTWCAGTQWVTDLSRA